MVMIMANKPVADDQERQRALNIAESFIVQAPAGSGKTELLIRRYLALLARVEQPEQIVAITFTNKAAAEMRDRVCRALADAANGAPEQSAHEYQTWQLAQAVLAQDQRQQWQVQDNPGRLRIQTVDSFCAFLTRQMPLLSRLGAQPGIVEDPEPLYREAAGRTLAQLEAGEVWSDHIAALLTYLDNDLPRARNLIAAMLKQRDQWLRHIAGGVQREELEGALRRLVEDSLAGLSDEFPAALALELIELLNFAAANLERGDIPSVIRTCVGLQGMPDGSSVALPQWYGVADLLLTREGKWRKAVTVREGFPPGEKGGKSGAATMKDRMKAMLAQLSGNEALLRRLVEARHLPPVTYDDQEWEIAAALSALLLLAEAELRLVFSERNQIDFMGIAMAANGALEEAGVPTDLALHMDYQIQHLLIDEFQDISINQYLLLGNLTAGWSSGDGRTLFLVGDPMQSIYRFREAEVGKFLETWQRQRLGDVPLTPLNIRVNFRSRAGIVDWVNGAFAQVMPETPDIARGAVNFEAAQAFHRADKDPAVIVHPQRQRDDSAEAQEVVGIIGAERATEPHGSIAILVRNRNHLYAIVPALQAANLRFRAVEIDPLAARPAIQDLLVLTRALLHRGDRIAWLAALRAPWCGLTLTEITGLTTEAAPPTVWQCLQQTHRIAEFAPTTLTRLRRLCAAFSAAMGNQGLMPMHRQVESLWLALGGPATLQDAADLDNAQAFFDLLAEHEEGGEVRDLSAFIQAVEKLYAAPDLAADGTLQIMTMHKAKGLEFDTVILPGLGRGRRHDEPALLLWDERARDDGDQDLLLAPIKAVGGEDVPLYKCLQFFEKERQDFEEGRLLYVAATRARRRLHLLGSVSEDKDGEVKPPPRNSLLRQLWPVLANEFESVPVQAGGSASMSSQVMPTGAGQLLRLPAGWTPPPAPDAVVWARPFPDEVMAQQPEFAWAGETLKHVGTVFHQAMQRIAADGLEHWDVQRVRGKAGAFSAMLRQLGVPRSELESALSLVQQALMNTIEDDRGRWILSGEHREAHNEFALTGIYGGRPVSVILDRTFVDADGVRWVIDYKTSRHEGADREEFLKRELERYAEPLERYRTLLAALHPQPVNVALYFPLLRGWISV